MTDNSQNPSSQHSQQPPVANSTSLNPAAQVSSTTNNFDLQFLCSLIPKSFDGKRIEFSEFKTNCENAMLLANDNQKHPLLVFIISKLTGNVRSQLQGKTYSNWNELRAILNGLYQDQKHYIQLMEELNTLKQGVNESVSSFHERLDRLVTRIINTMAYKDPAEQKIKIETIKDIALSRFIHHSVPEISRFLRGQSVSTVSEALSKAVAEERALKISNEEFRQKSKQNIFCNICKRNGHSPKNCFQNKSSSNNILLNQSSLQSNVNPQQIPTNHYSQKFCRYCKRKGHLIQECRKREYVNKIRNNPQNQNETNNSANVHLNFTDPPAATNTSEA